jgi:hypothetical protein
MSDSNRELKRAHTPEPDPPVPPPKEPPERTPDPAREPEPPPPPIGDPPSTPSMCRTMRPASAAHAPRWRTDSPLDAAVYALQL